jgi:calcineurin-like phosphoesterase family protein
MRRSATALLLLALASCLDPGPSLDLAIGDAVLVGAGDIGVCGSNNDEATSNLLDTLPGLVFTAGDNAYVNGTATEFATCYDPSWGRHRWRTRPSAGNHDYNTPGATGYFGYFGTAAGDPTKGYYSYDHGSWHIVALNSQVSMAAASAQEQWLRADLAANTRTCTLAYWHYPLFSSGEHGNITTSQAIWQALYDLNADVVVNGHDHTYERFGPQDPTGALDSVRGIKEFVVGTGGAALYQFLTIRTNSEVRINDTWGVIRFVLRPAGYEWQFISIDGAVRDQGSGSCH